jgi:hypothetical protein|tara:strand:+ start:2898 stop:3203 length:306 start_codon:yes stop_codon:yes gene_type:complete
MVEMSDLEKRIKGLEDKVRDLEIIHNQRHKHEFDLVTDKVGKKGIAKHVNSWVDILRRHLGGQYESGSQIIEPVYGGHSWPDDWKDRTEKAKKMKYGEKHG